MAYDNARLESAANSSQVTTAEQCKLGVSVVNARNSSHYTGNTHVLTATGCFPSSTNPNLPTSIQWSNGTVGAISENGTITFADGEVGRMPSYPLTRTIAINPTTNKSYIAICTMGGGASQKICTYTVDVKVLNNVCGTDFRIEVSKDTFDIGEPVSLSAIGCEGQVRWSGAFGSGSTVEIYPKEDLVVSASCLDGDNKICYSNSINLIAIECVNGIGIKSSNRYEKIKFFTGGKLVKKVTYSEFEFIADGCYNGVEWRKDGGGKEENNITHVGESYKVKDSRGYLAVHARCLPALPDGYCSWVGLMDLSILTQDCGGYSLSYDKESLSTALNKTPIGLVTIKADTKEFVNYLSDSYGNYFSPDSKQNFYVPLLYKSVVYTGHPLNGDFTCIVSVEVPGIRKFRIDWDKKRLKATKIIDENTYDFSVVNDERIDMSFKADGFPESNCTGTIVWTNNIDPDFKSTGELLTLTSPPTKTTTYYAACHFNNGDNTISIYPADNNKTIVIRSESCLTVKHDVLLPTNAISKGQKISFNVTGCGDRVTWTLGNQVIGLGRIFTHTPIPSQASVLTYKASCNFPACSQNVSINVTNCNFKITPSKTFAKIAERVALSASGCSGGEVQWSTGETGDSITVRPLEKMTYVANCMVDGASVCENSVTLTVDNSPPDDIECPQLVLTATPSTFEGCTNQLVTVKPSGCPASATISWWDGTVTQGGESRSFQLNKTTKIRGTCISIYDTPAHPLQSTAELEVTAQLTASFSVVSPVRAYAGYPVTISAFGCYTADCKDGNYRWENKTIIEPILYGSSVNVKVLRETTYEVSCNGVKKTVKIEMKEPQKCERSVQNTTTVNGYSKLIVNDKCDSDYSITWFDANNNKIVATNARSIKVKQTNDVQSYLVICATSEGVPCTEVLLTSMRPNAASVGDVTNEEISIPNPCKDLEINAVKTMNSPSSILYLQSGFCPGIVQWFSDESKSSSSYIATIRDGERHTVGKITSPKTYYYTCSVSGAQCQGSATANPATSSAREAATTATTSTIIDAQCSSTISLATAMAQEYSKLICQLLEVAKGDDGIITEVEAEGLLTKVKSAAQSAYPDYYLKFPADDGPVVSEIMKGKCDTQAGVLLAAPSEGILVEVDKFSEDKGEKHGEMLDGVSSETVKSQHLPIYENSNIQFNYHKLGTVTLFEMTDEEDAEDEVGSITLNMYSTEDPGIAAEAAECLNNPPGITPEEIAAMYNADTYVDMSACPRSYKSTVTSYTSPTKVPRNHRYYFDKLLEKQLNGQIPPMLSEEAIASIQKGKVPVIDDDWIKFNSKHALYKGDILEHHHYNRTNVAVALPRGFHKKYHNVLHYGEEVIKNVAQYCKNQNIGIDKKKLFRRSVKGFSIVFSFLDIWAWIKGDPQSIYALYESKKKGKLFYAAERDVYILVNEVLETNENIIIKYAAFSDYGYDYNIKKYIGVNLIGVYNEFYNKKTKISTFSVYN